jgi:hypothetical protein
MRRLWIVVAAAVTACAGLAGQPSLAYAERGSTTPAATSCSDLVKQYKGFSDASQRALNETNNPRSLRRIYAGIAKALNRLASSGPSQLHAPFQHLAQYIGRLAHLDFSNSSSLQQFASSARTLRPDIRKIDRYFGSVCRFTPSTT